MKKQIPTPDRDDERGSRVERRSSKPRTHHAISECSPPATASEQDAFSTGGWAPLS